MSALDGATRQEPAVTHGNGATGRPVAAGLLAVTVLLAGLVLGSRNLLDYDPALLTYTFGTLLALFVAVYRVTVWLGRPPTRTLWRRSFAALRQGGLVSLRLASQGLVRNLGGQGFLWRRSPRRWLAHVLISWGTLLALAVTLPLVLGWIHFETAGDLEDGVWRPVVFGLRGFEFSLASPLGHLILNLLNLSAVMVIAGVLMALHRRLKTSNRSLVRQRFGHDLTPLIMLFAISLTGLMLTFSTHALEGYGYSEISLLHALTVTLTMVYAPFGKLFHIFVRPARLGVALCQRANQARAPVACKSCGDRFAGAIHHADLKAVLVEVGFDWQLAGPVDHYADVCPRCRRRLLGVCQGELVKRSRTGDGDTTQKPANPLLVTGAGRPPAIDGRR